VLHQSISTEFPETAYRLRNLRFHGDELFLVDNGDHAPAVYSGRVFVYRLQNDRWTFVQAIQSPRPTRLLGFGSGFAVEGNRLLIGANTDPLRGHETGAIFEFEREGALWVYRGNEFPLPTGIFVRAMGQNLAMSGDVAVSMVGLAGPLSPQNKIRIVGVFRRLQGTWVVERLLRRPDPIAGGDFFGFGTGLDVSEDWIAVGSTRDIYPFWPGPGSVYMFPREPLATGTWALPQVLQASNATFGPWTSDWFGGTVQLDGSRMLVTAKSHGHTQAMNAESGAAYLFQLDQGVWRERLQLSSRRIQSGGPGTFGLFGEHAAIDGNVIVVTDWTDPETSAWPGFRGAAYVFEFPLGATYCSQAGNPALTITGVARAAECALTAELDGAPTGAICVVASSLLAPSSPLPSPIGFGLCLAPGPIRLATAVAPVANGNPLRMPLWGFPHAAGGPAMAGTRWTFQAVCCLGGGTQAPCSVPSNGVVLALE